MKPAQLKRQQLLVIFVLAVVVSVSLGTILPASTQTSPSPSPTLSPSCEQLQVNIQTRAKKDAEVDRLNFFTPDKRKKTINDIFNLYKEANLKNTCFPPEKLWDIYEQKYDAHKYPFWMPVLAILLLGGILVAAINDTLKKWVNQSLEAMGKLID